MTGVFAVDKAYSMIRQYVAIVKISKNALVFINFKF